MSQNRNRWLDIAKGIAIILMVAGHTPIPSVMSHFIYAFHMPLFFISSGLVSNYEKYSLVDYIKHKSYTLLLPFVCYSTIVAFCIQALTICSFTFVITICCDIKCYPSILEIDTTGSTSAS